MWPKQEYNILSVKYSPNSLGMAILRRKCFNAYCSIKLYDCDIIIGIEFAYDSFKALFLCVYLPYDCAENFDDYMFYLSQLLQIIEDLSSPYV